MPFLFTVFSSDQAPFRYEDPHGKKLGGSEAGCDNWVNHSAAEPLENFQVVVAAAEAWQAVRCIRIVELRQEIRAGRALINGLGFRRLR